jgi:hypothetical protein
MKMVISRVLSATAASAAVAVLLAVGVAHSTGTRHLDGPTVSEAATEAEQAFADAPYGVDPMVTGPTTASFKRKQAIAGCNEAIWPNVPLDCYPDH